MTFSHLLKVGKQYRELWVPLMQLGLEGYGENVVEVRAGRNKEMASIQLDRPYEGEAFEMSQLAEKKIGWLVKWNIRLFWEIKE